MVISGNTTVVNSTALLRQADVPQPAQGPASPSSVPDAQIGPAAAFGQYSLPFPPPPGWIEAQAAFHERALREGVNVTDQMRFIPPTEEERAEHAKEIQAVFARSATSQYTANGHTVPDNHDTHVPNLAGLSLKWASVVRDVVQDLVKQPGPGTLYGGYGDKTTSSATELLGWIDEYIAKLSTDTKAP